MRDLRELQRIIEDFEQGFQMPEMQDGLPGGWNPSVEGLQQGVMGEGTSVEDVIFGRQGPRWDGVGMDVESFGGGTQGNRRYPSAEPGPSGSAAPDITPEEAAMDDVIEYYGSEGESGPAPEVAAGLADAVEFFAEGVSAAWENEQTRFVILTVLSVVARRPLIGALGKVTLEGDTADPPSEDRQPNPEGDDTGGPAVDTRIPFVACWSTTKSRECCPEPADYQMGCARPARS